MSSSDDLSLISLSEPQDSSPDPQASPRPVVGIDLGTTNSLVGVVEAGAVKMLTDDDGKAVIASALHYAQDGTVTVGNSALAANTNAGALVTSSKRLLGLESEAFELACASAGYQVDRQSQSEHQGNDGRIILNEDATSVSVSAVEASSQLLRMLWALARKHFQDEPEGCVISVPAYFGEKQRQAVRLAARLQGINVLRLLDEPTAAAIAYGLDHEDSRYVMVYDLGGGTFDVSVIRLSQGIFEVLAIGGDDALGGDDFDALIVDWMRRSIGEDISTAPVGVLRRKARQVKEELTDQASAQIDFADIGLARTLVLSVQEMEAMFAPLVETTMRLSAQAIVNAGLEVGKLDKIILAGGSTRVPMIRRVLASQYSQEILDEIDPEQVVAQGAVLHANQLVGNLGNRHLLLGVLPLSLGIETMGGIVEVILTRNTSLPARMSQHFTTHQNNQTGMIFHIVQGEREMSRDCRSLARFELKGLPPAPAGLLKIELTLEVDADGLLTASACHPESGAQVDIEVRPSSGLSDTQVQQMLQDSYRHAEDDLRQRLSREQRLEVDRVLHALDDLLGKAADMPPAQRQEIQDQADTLRGLLDSGDYEAIQNALTTLNEKSSDLVRRVLDQKFTEYLAGQQIEAS